MMFHDPIFNAIVDGNAKGDGVTDDTVALTLGCQIATSLGKVFYIPPGTYKISGTITGNSSLQTTGSVIRILGVPEQTKIISTTTADILHIGNGKPVSGLVCGYVEGLTLVGVSSKGQRGLVIDRMTQFRIRDMDIGNTEIGIDFINNCYGAIISNVRVGFYGSCNIGVYIRTGNQSGNQLFFENSWISGATAAVSISPGADGIYFRGGQYSTTTAADAVFIIGKDYLTGSVGGVGTIKADSIDTEGAPGHWFHSYGMVNLTVEASDFLGNGSTPSGQVLKAEGTGTSRFSFRDNEWGGQYANPPITITGDYGNTLLISEGWNASAGNLILGTIKWDTDQGMDPCLISGLTKCCAIYTPFTTKKTTVLVDGKVVIG